MDSICRAEMFAGRFYERIIKWKIIKAELNAPTSVKESTLQKGMVYPNPAKQSLNIELSYVSLNSNFTIMDTDDQMRLIKNTLWPGDLNKVGSRIAAPSHLI